MYDYFINQLNLSIKLFNSLVARHKIQIDKKTVKIKYTLLLVKQQQILENYLV